MNLRLRTEILKRGLRQTEIAYKAGIDGSTFSKYVSGWRTPSEDTKRRIAEVMNCTVPQIFPKRVRPGRFK